LPELRALKRAHRTAGRSQSAVLNKLGEEFIEALFVSFEAKGAQAIRRVCDENPKAFLQVLAGLAREELEPCRSELSNFSAEEIDPMLEAVMRQ
jgi:hypothetical protein